ncbi:MAG: hypothetical protein G01um101493_274 [Microgenomates group bacterium Gr01-1014_93]|nr:MAG: hypothetical protein G01um101493_274 [Microgenomates group bacterium Gr01-1014_93]
MDIEKNNQTDCFPLGAYERDSTVLARDMVIKRGGKTFTITVGTEDYLEVIRRENKGLDEGSQLSESCFLLDDVTDADMVCRVLSDQPIETLTSFLIEQSFEEN